MQENLIPQGINNSFFGQTTGATNLLGDRITLVGANADVSADGFNNTTAIGFSAQGTASQQVRIGNSFVTSIGGYAGWSNISDGRFKTSVREDVKGLDFILQLRPVTYNLDIDGINRMLYANRKDPLTAADQSGASSKSSIRYSGFVAQEVEAISKQLGYDFSGVDAPKNANDFYSLRYAEFVVPLVKAVQEQQKIIEAQNATIESLKQQNNLILEQLSVIKKKLGIE